MFFPSLILPYLAQNSSSVSAAELELLKEQMEFLQQANSQLTNSFNAFVGAINLSFVIIGLVLAILGLVGSFFYGKTLTDVKHSVGAVAKQEVERLVSITIKERVDYLQRVLEREKVIGWVSLEYILPTGQGNLPPKEFNLLKNRGFQDAEFKSRSLQASKRSNLVVLDVANKDFGDEEIVEKAEEVIRGLSPGCVLVIYIKRRLNALNELLNEVTYSAIANTPITLMGTAVDAAYVADALRQREEGG